MDRNIKHNLLVTAWNVFLLVGIVWLIVAHNWSTTTLIWVFIIGASWRGGKHGEAGE
jgi:hypothetical protein